MKRIITSIITIISAFLLVPLIAIIIFFSGTTQEGPLLHKAVKVTISQSQDQKLALSEIRVENIYPSDFKFDYSQDYYRVKLYGKNDKVLLSGKELYKDTIVVMPLTAENAPLPTVTLMDKLVMYLPYYKEAEKIVISDESSNPKLEINLADYPLDPGPTQNLCGNGICDQNENMLSCFSDCKYQINTLKETFTEKLLP